MFDIGFTELLLVGLVALVVLGPERLPKAARFTGLWVRRARAQWYAVKAEFENELADDELRRSLRDTGQQLRDAREAAGQLLRLALVPLGHALARLPMGNIGRARVSAFAPMEPRPEITQLIDEALAATAVSEILDKKWPLRLTSLPKQLSNDE